MRYFDLFGITGLIASLVIWHSLLVASIRSLTGNMGLVTPSEIASVATIYMRQVVAAVTGICYYTSITRVLALWTIENCRTYTN
jgi:hypothetical protein